MAAFALTGLIRDADSTIGATYTLVALAAVSLGGTVFGGKAAAGSLAHCSGRSLHPPREPARLSVGVSAFWLQIVYGAAVLVVAIRGPATGLASLVSEPVFQITDSVSPPRVPPSLLASAQAKRPHEGALEALGAIRLAAYPGRSGIRDQRFSSSSAPRR